MDQNQHRFVLLAVGGVVAFLAVMILLRPRSSTTPASSDGGTPAYIPTSNYDITINSPAPGTPGTPGSPPPVHVPPPPVTVPPVSRPPAPTPRPRPPAPTPRPPVALPPRPVIFQPISAPVQRMASSASSGLTRIAVAAQQIVNKPRPVSEKAAPRVYRAPVSERAAPRPAPVYHSPPAHLPTPTYDSGPIMRRGIGRGMPSGGNFDLIPAFPWGYN